jgi:hypothetical protein
LDIYRHKQVGTLLMLGLGATALACGAGVYAATGEALGAAAVVGLILITNLLFSSLEIAVDGREVVVAFGPGLIRKRFAVADIAAARAVRNAWWYGWGIHLTPHGWLFNVAGLDAVELEMKSGRKVRIGTDEPLRLVAAIERVAPAARERA